VKPPRVAVRRTRRPRRLVIALRQLAMLSARDLPPARQVEERDGDVAAQARQMVITMKSSG
jgi:hypothetical protein